jgi:hypothetical protein
LAYAWPVAIAIVVCVVAVGGTPARESCSVTEIGCRESRDGSGDQPQRTHLATAEWMGNRASPRMPTARKAPAPARRSLVMLDLGNPRL